MDLKGVKVIYMAGNMNGLADYEREKFEGIEKQLRDMGFVVLNPGIIPEGMPSDRYMPIRLAMVEQSDAVIMMSNWTESADAMIERKYAKRQGKIIVYPGRLS